MARGLFEVRRANTRAERPRSRWSIISCVVFSPAPPLPLSLLAAMGGRSAQRRDGARRFCAPRSSAPLAAGREARQRGSGQMRAGPALPSQVKRLAVRAQASQDEWPREPRSGLPPDKVADRLSISPVSRRTGPVNRRAPGRSLHREFPFNAAPAYLRSRATFSNIDYPGVLSRNPLTGPGDDV